MTDSSRPDAPGTGIATTWGFLDGPKRQGRALLGLVIASFVIRVVYVLCMRGSPAFDHPQMDALYHVEWARAFAAGETYQEGPFFRAPLYPWFLGVLFKLFGDGLLLPRLVQCAFGAAATALVFRLGRAAFDARVGSVAAALHATNWVLIYFDGELLIPTLILPLNLLALDVSLRFLRAPRLRTAWFAGLFWGLSCIARPNPLVFLPLLALAFALRARRAPGNEATAPPRPLAAVGALLLGLAMPIAPITAYNVIAGEDTVLIASQAGVNLWIGNNPQSDGSTAIVPGTRGTWWGGFEDAVAQAERAEGRALRPSEVSSHYVGRALGHMSSNPTEALGHMLHKVKLFFSDTELGNNLEMRFFMLRFGGPIGFLPPALGVIGGFGVLLGLGSVGVWMARRRCGEGARVLGLFLLSYSAGVVLFFVCSRFRVPIVPVLQVFAAVGVVEVLDRIRGRDRRLGWLGLAGALGIAALSIALPTRALNPVSNGHLQLAVIAFEQGDPSTALDELDRALEAEPAHPLALRLRGRSKQALGRPDAEADYRAAIDVNRGDPDSWFALAQWLQSVRRFPECIEAYAEVEARAPHLAATPFELGRVRFELQDLGAAAEAFRLALTRDPNHFMAAFNLGLVEGRLAHPREELEAFLWALEHPERGEPTYLRTAVQRAMSLLQSAGRGPEAQALGARWSGLR